MSRSPQQGTAVPRRKSGPRSPPEPAPGSAQPRPLRNSRKEGSFRRTAGIVCPPSPPRSRGHLKTRSKRSRKSRVRGAPAGPGRRAPPSSPNSANLAGPGRPRPSAPPSCLRERVGKRGDPPRGPGLAVSGGPDGLPAFCAHFIRTLRNPGPLRPARAPRAKPTGLMRPRSEEPSSGAIRAARAGTSPRRAAPDPEAWR
ncbi:basic proline-rich protein [Nycticebus coucang]|uniref:basic proline-rich protein n=1 Tax=Nycticebus coucang TaxID=9470 RepID=UPI00234D7A29|nr:basic proline-rich protein [Nycticebus coucang]